MESLAFRQPIPYRKTRKKTCFYLSCNDHFGKALDYTTVSFRKATDGGHIGFSRWPPYKTCLCQYLSFRVTHDQDLGVQSDVFVVKEYNCTIKKNNRWRQYWIFQDDRHIKTYFCLNISF